MDCSRCVLTDCCGVMEASAGLIEEMITAAALMVNSVRAAAMTTLKTFLSPTTATTTITGYKLRQTRTTAHRTTFRILSLHILTTPHDRPTSLSLSSVSVL